MTAPSGIDDVSKETMNLYWRLNRNLGQVVEALNYRPSEILPVEVEQKAKLKWKGQPSPVKGASVPFLPLGGECGR